MTHTPFTLTGTPTQQMVNALQTITNSVAADLMPVPTSVDLWVQYVPADELITLANRFHVKIRFIHPDKVNAFAGIRADTTATGTPHIRLIVHSTDMGPDDVRAYNTYNAGFDE
jgi:hypothetical protein